MEEWSLDLGRLAQENLVIIGDPRSIKMQKTMNLKIKYRESFRPFAPAVMEEHVNDYFKMDFGNSYMSFVFPIQDKIKLKTGEKGLSINEKLMQKDLHFHYHTC